MQAVVLPQLKRFGRRVTSQNDEDGILETIFEIIPPRSRTFLEFGIGPNYQDREYSRGLEGNCVQLREKGWQGVFLDGGCHPEQFNVKQEFVTALNINKILQDNQLTECDVISIDVDGQDFWIWMAIASRPSVVVVEYNPNWFALHQRKTVPFDINFRWDWTQYYGASLGALLLLGADRGYTLVYANGINAFFVRNDLFANHTDFDPVAIQVTFAQHAPDHLQRPWLTM